MSLQRWNEKNMDVLTHWEESTRLTVNMINKWAVSSEKEMNLHGSCISSSGWCASARQRSSVTRQQASRPPHPLSRACQKLPYAAGRVAAACADVPRPVADVPNDCYSWRRSLIGGDTIRRDGGLQSEQETASGREWTLAGEAHACTVWNCGLEQVLGILSPAQFWAFLRLLASGGAGEEVCVHFAALQY